MSDLSLSAVDSSGSSAWTFPSPLKIEDSVKEEEAAILHDSHHHLQHFDHPTGENRDPDHPDVAGPSPPPPLCAGCQLRIVDKYFLSAVDSKWHTNCLKCSDCGMPLESQVSCYERDGLIFCKDDYLRIYGHRANIGIKQCARCMLPIGPAELVMRAKCFLYHVDCFKCAVCDGSLIKGDLFGMFEAVVYCQTHYRQQQQFFMQHAQLHEDRAGVGLDFFPFDQDQHPDLEGGQGWPPSSRSGPRGYTLPPGSGSGGNNVNSGGNGNGNGRSSVNNGSIMGKKKRGRRKRDLLSNAPHVGDGGQSVAAAGGCEDDLSGGNVLGVVGGGGGVSRPPCFPYLDPTSSLAEKTKRARTSFKHHQLRIMKSHFQINQNPDSRELKDLASKTGLDKKVLQVWFQNARAKFRRMNNAASSTSSTPAAAISNPTSMDSLDSMSYSQSPPVLGQTQQALTDHHAPY